MPIKQEEMKSIADAATALRDLYLGDFGQLGVLRSMYVETGEVVHLEALLETLDRLVWSADGACAAHMVAVERYLERYRLTASANAANAERKRRARARLAQSGGGKQREVVRDVLEATTQGELTQEEWRALSEHNVARGFVPRADVVRRLPPDAGMAELPGIGGED